MVLDHERLDVYHLSLDFLVFANEVNEVIEALPRGRTLQTSSRAGSGTGTVRARINGHG